MKLFTNLSIACSIAALAFSAGARDNRALQIHRDYAEVSFYTSVKNIYKVADSDMVQVRAAHLPDREVPIVFFISTRSKVRPAEIAAYRTKGRPWIDVARHYGVGPASMYVKFNTPPIGAYGRTWEYYNRYSHSDWNMIYLTDDDVINLVNLRFMAKRYGLTVDQIARGRTVDRDFVTFHRELAQKRTFPATKSRVFAATPASRPHRSN